MLDRKIDGIIGWTIGLSILALFGVFILWWRAVRPNPLVRIPVSIVLIFFSLVLIGALSS
ncbi:MAG TPA: hypothetical protein VH482_23690 [Thermomicrobiales bacterium]|jgi:hypothetical protein